MKKPYKIIKQQCYECGHPTVREITESARYEWYCPHCGLIIWRAGEIERT